MPEVAQELTFQNTAQPIVIEITPAETEDEPQSLAVIAPTSVTIELTPAD
jgi:hypothetical protein